MWVSVDNLREHQHNSVLICTPYFMFFFKSRHNLHAVKCTFFSEYRSASFSPMYSPVTNPQHHQDSHSTTPCPVLLGNHFLFPADPWPPLLYPVPSFWLGNEPHSTWLLECVLEEPPLFRGNSATVTGQLLALGDPGGVGCSSTFHRT